MRNSNIVFVDKMISNEKVVNYNVVYFSRSTTFSFVISLSKVVYETHATSKIIIKILENLRINIWGA